MDHPRILIVEDDAIQAYHLQVILAQLGYQVAGMAATGEDAVRLAVANRPDAILMDINLRGGMTGLEAAVQIRARVDVPVVYLTAYTDDSYLQAVKNTDGYAFLAKPVRDRDLRASLEMTLYKHSVERRIEHLNQVLRAIRSIDQLINREKDPSRLLEQARQILLQKRSYRAVWICPLEECRNLSQADMEQAFRADLLCQPGGEGIQPQPGQMTCLAMVNNGQSYGWLCVLAEQPRGSQAGAAFDSEEIDLLGEVAEDIAYGLRSIQEEAARKQAEEKLTELNRTLELRVQERTAELSAANRELEKAARLKDEFLASMSHELRTPLTGILGLSQALQFQTYGELNEKQSQVLANIESSGRHLLDLINDILDLSKIEAGKLEMHLEPVSLAEICQAALQLVKGLVGQKNQLVSFSISPETIFIRADGRRLKQIIVNLLGNAVKFSPDGSPIGLEVQGDPRHRRVELVVWDRGIGIQPEDLNRLFQPFIQLDSSLARQYSGTGLGLSLVRRMVELHGGSIRVESSSGEGSRFILTLPWSGRQNLSGHTGPLGSLASPDRSSGGQTAPAAPVSAQPGAHILIVDDNPLVRDTMVETLEREGYQVSLAAGGARLVELAAEIHPHVIVLDIQLPGLDGIEATRRLRACPDPAVAAIPVIAMTDLVMPNDRERCLAAGMNEYLSKPIFLPELHQIIRDLLNR